MSRPGDMARLNTTATSVEEPHCAQPALAFQPPDEFVKPSRWRLYRDLIRQPAAEFLGTMLLVLFGTGVNCQVSLSANTGVASSPKGDYLSVSFGWAVGLSIGVWVSAGISGGHINPAPRDLERLSLEKGSWWYRRGWDIYANYVHAIDIVEGSRNIRTLATAGNFGTFSLDYMTNVSCFFTEFLGTAILVLVILAVTDARNSPPPSGLLPLVLFIVFLGIAASLGMQTGFALNPARDLGPRILTSMVGYGTEVYTFRNHYWIWCPIMASILGAQIATLLYDTILLQGEQSVTRKPDDQTRQRMEMEKVV
ncbi:aquaporin-like protein [Mucidula mucida]|nr:aquaporin-like protein [Mucidula mucida]